MSMQNMNFEDLRLRAERADSFELTSSILATYRAPRLRHLLRHHLEEGVEGPDTVRRDAFDETLAHYSLMEVASVAGYVPAPLPAEYRDAALTVLRNGSVQPYYEKNYPLLLPRAHRERLLGTWTDRETGADAAPLFASFSELNETIEEDDDVEMFLWFLEDGYVDGYSLADLLEIIEDPERFSATLAPEQIEGLDQAELLRAIQQKGALEKPEELTRRFASKKRKKTPAERALHGFRKFLFFCRELDHLLRRSGKYPLLQSAMWHHHAYWFDELSDELRPYMADAVDRFASWDVAPEETLAWMGERSAIVDDTRRERAEAIADLRDSLARLTSGEYGGVFRERFAAAQRRARVSSSAPARIAPARRQPAARSAATVAGGRVAAAGSEKASGASKKRSKPARKVSGKKKPKLATAARPAAAKASKGRPRKIVKKAAAGAKTKSKAKARPKSGGKRGGGTGRR